MSDATAPPLGPTDAAATYCTAQAAGFCEDFDRSPVLSPNWVPYKKSGATTRIAVGKTALSKPYGLDFEGVGDDYGGAYVAVLPNPPAASFTFDLLLEDALGTWFVELDWDEGLDRKHGVRLLMGPSSGTMVEFDGTHDNPTPTQSVPVPFPSTPGWHHVVVDIDWVATPALATLRIDESPITSVPLKAAYVAGGTCFVQLGAFQFGSASDVRVHRLTFDNVTATMLPQ